MNILGYDFVIEYQDNPVFDYKYGKWQALCLCDDFWWSGLFDSKKKAMKFIKKELRKRLGNPA